MPIQDPEPLTEVEWFAMQKEFALIDDLGPLFMKWSQLGVLSLLFFLFLDLFYSKKIEQTFTLTKII